MTYAVMAIVNAIQCENMLAECDGKISVLQFEKETLTYKLCVGYEKLDKISEEYLEALFMQSWYLEFEMLGVKLDTDVILSMKKNDVRCCLLEGRRNAMARSLFIKEKRLRVVNYELRVEKQGVEELKGRRGEIEGS